MNNLALTALTALTALAAVARIVRGSSARTLVCVLVPLTPLLGACRLLECQPADPARSDIIWQPATPGGVLRGQVLAIDGAVPLLGVTVSAIGGRASTMTDAEGKFQLALSPGSYTIRVARRGYLPAQETVQLRADTGAALIAALERSRSTLDACQTVHAQHS